MNVLVIGAASVAITGAALFGAYSHGVSVAEGRQAARDLGIIETREAAAQGAAEAISKIKVVNQTIKGQVQREIQTNTVYRDCVVPADGMRLINEAITGKPSVSTGSGKLSTTDTDGR